MNPRDIAGERKKKKKKKKKVQCIGNTALSAWSTEEQTKEKADGPSTHKRQERPVSDN